MSFFSLISLTRPVSILTGLVLFLFAHSCQAQDLHNPGIQLFLHKVDSARQVYSVFEFDQVTTMKFFTETDTSIENKRITLSINKNEIRVKKEDKSGITIIHPDSTYKGYTYKDSIVWEGKKAYVFDEVFLPFHDQYNNGVNLSIIKIDTFAAFYRLTRIFSPDSLFSHAEIVTDFRKKDFFPISCMDIITLQGMSQYRKVEIDRFKKLESDEKLFMLDNSLPVKKIVNCHEGRILGDFTKYENMVWNVPSVQTIQGKSIDLQKTNARVFIFDCFYSGCYPCIKSVPALNAIHEKYDDKVFILGIDPIDDDPTKILRFIDNFQVKYPVAQSPEPVIEKFRVTSYPTLLVFDSQFKFIQGLVGYHENLEQELDAIIKEYIR